MAMRAASGPAGSSALPGSFALEAAPAYSPLTENEVVSTCTCSALIPKIWRARLAIPANSLVRSCAYNQSRVRPKQSSLSISAVIPAPSKCSTGLLAKYCGTKYNCRLLKPKPLSTIATVADPTLTRLSIGGLLRIQPGSQADLL